MLLTAKAAARRALDVTKLEQPDEDSISPWQVSSVRWRPILPVLPSPFLPEDSYLNVGGHLRELRGLMPPAWQVELHSTNLREANYSSDHTYHLLLAMLDGRVLARLTGIAQGFIAAP